MKRKYNKILFLCLLALYNSKITIFAKSIESSKFGVGTKDLINDLFKFLLILSPIIGGLLGAYFFMRMGAADEQDQKRWKNRIILDVICTVGTFVISGIITLVVSYYK